MVPSWDEKGFSQRRIYFFSIKKILLLLFFISKQHYLFQIFISHLDIFFPALSLFYHLLIPFPITTTSYYYKYHNITKTIYIYLSFFLSSPLSSPPTPLLLIYIYTSLQKSLNNNNKKKNSLKSNNLHVKVSLKKRVVQQSSVSLVRRSLIQQKLSILKRSHIIRIVSSVHVVQRRLKVVSMLHNLIINYIVVVVFKHPVLTVNKHKLSGHQRHLVHKHHITHNLQIQVVVTNHVMFVIRSVILQKLYYLKRIIIMQIVYVVKKMVVVHYVQFPMLINLMVNYIVIHVGTRVIITRSNQNQQILAQSHLVHTLLLHLSQVVVVLHVPHVKRLVILQKQLHLKVSHIMVNVLNVVNVH